MPSFNKRRSFSYCVKWFCATSSLLSRGMISYLWSLIYIIYRRSLKWLIRLFTGKCELLRIVQSNHDQLKKVMGIEQSLKLSKYASLRNLLHTPERDSGDMVNQIVIVKDIKLASYPQFGSSMKCYLDLIVGYKGLISEIDYIRKTTYSNENEEHEKLLLQLWGALKSEENLIARKSKQWESIGFQGSDPATDFRGMGLLGLQCLLYLATNHKETANYMLSHSVHPQYGYSFAIVGINMTSLSYQLLVRGKLRQHFYSHLRGRPSLQDFYLVFVHFFYEFDKFWISSKPKSIMEFETTRNQFEGLILKELQYGVMPLSFSFL